MAATAGDTTITFPVTDTVNDTVVEESLLTELQALVLSELVVQTVDVVAGTIKVGCSYTPADGANISADITAITNAIAAHQGEPIGTEFQKLQNDGDQAFSTIANDQQIIQLQTDALKAGEYLTFYSCEVESTNVATDGAWRAELFSTGKAQENFSGIFRRTFSTQISTTRNAGEKVTARMEIDLVAGAVTCRNRRIQVLKVPANGS